MTACNPDVMIDAYTPALSLKIKEKTLGKRVPIDLLRALNHKS